MKIVMKYLNEKIKPSLVNQRDLLIFQESFLLCQTIETSDQIRYHPK
jgi:hypothetical protein